MRAGSIVQQSSGDRGYRQTVNLGCPSVERLPCVSDKDVQLPSEVDIGDVEEGGAS